MQKGFLNSPTDGNSVMGRMNTMIKQSLSGPDVVTNSVRQSMPPAPYKKDCGCNGNKSIPPQPATPQPTKVQQAKNYYNKIAVQYPKQIQ